VPGWLVDPGTLQFLAVNEAAVHRFGWTRDEFLGMALDDLRAGPDVPDALSRHADFNGARELTAGQPRLWVQRHKNGTPIAVEVSGTRIPWRGREVILMTGIEVTGWLRDGEDARKRIERFELASRAISEMMWDWNVTTGEVWNENSDVLQGGEPPHGPSAALEWRARIHPEDRDRVVAKMERTLRGPDDHWADEFRLRGAGNTWRYCMARGRVLRDASGAPLRLVGTTVDISDRRCMEEELRAQSHRLQALFDNAQDAILLSNNEGAYLDANPAACALLGYTREELKQRTTWDLTLPEDLARYRQNFERMITTGSYADEGRRVRKDGSIVIVEYRTLANIEPGVHLVVMRDITQKKLDEESLRNLSGRLLRLQDEERRRLARELHDSTAQSLAAAAMKLQVVYDASGTMMARARDALIESRELVDECSKEIRTLSYLLHPPLLDEMGLTSTLQGYVQGFSQRSGIRTQLELPADLGRLPREHETTLFRIVQESLTNIHRHSGSRTALVRMVQTPDAIRLEVSDLGRGGVRGPDNGASELGVGIAGMRERLRQLGGRLEIESDRKGTTVRAVLPRAT
jgi:PAS domain S-box-containing protein